MIPVPTLPPVEAVLALHAELVAEFGGEPGIRDRGAVEASMARPLQILAYSESEVTLYDLAAAVCNSLCRSPTFIDGYRRIAFVTLGMILGMNGVVLDATERDAADAIAALAAGRYSERDFALWVARNSFDA